MDLIKVKDAAEFQLSSCDVSVERENDSLKRILIKDGDALWIITANVYGNVLEIYKPKPPEMVLRYKLTGNFLVFPVNKLFETSQAAQEALGALERAGATDCKIKEVMVEASVAAKAEQPTDDIPF